MTDRLTYSPQSKNDRWTQLMFPAMLLLGAIALIPIKDIPDSYMYSLNVAGNELFFSFESIALLVVMALSGLLIRRLLPAKSPAPLKAFASVSGMGMPFVFLQGFIPYFENPFYNFAGSALMLSGWIFSIYARDKSMIWTIASGLTLGVASFLAPICMAGAGALLIYQFLFTEQELKHKLGQNLLWVAAFICGTIPALKGEMPVPVYNSLVYSVDSLLGGLQFILQNAPIWSWVFIAIALVVAVLQKQKIILALILPFLLIRLLLNGFLPVELLGVECTLLIPFAWLTAYGMLRVIRGLEQGVRKVNPKQAKLIPTIATLCFIVGFLIKIADFFYFAA